MNNALNYIDSIRNEKKEELSKYIARVDASNRAYAEVLQVLRKHREDLTQSPASVMQHIRFIEGECRRIKEETGAAVSIPFVEPDRNNSYSRRRDELVPAEGGFTFASFFTRLVRVLRLLEQRTPGCAPDLRANAAPAVREVTPPRVEVKEELRETLADAADIKLPPRKRGAEPAAVRKLREAKEKRI